MKSSSDAAAVPIIRLSLTHDTTHSTQQHTSHNTRNTKSEKSDADDHELATGQRVLAWVTQDRVHARGAQLLNCSTAQQSTACSTKSTVSYRGE